MRVSFPGFWVTFCVTRAGFPVWCLFHLPQGPSLKFNPQSFNFCMHASGHLCGMEQTVEAILKTEFKRFLSGHSGLEYLVTISTCKILFIDTIYNNISYKLQYALYEEIMYYMHLCLNYKSNLKCKTLLPLVKGIKGVHQFSMFQGPNYNTR